MPPISLAGLTGSLTPTNPAIAISSASAYAPFDNTAQWFQNGTLLIRVNNTALANVTYTFSFVLVNPMKGQLCPPIYISSSSCFFFPYVNEYGHLVQSPCLPTMIAPTLLGQGPGDLAPLLVVYFVSQLLYQSTSDQVLPKERTRRAIRTFIPAHQLKLMFP